MAYFFGSWKSTSPHLGWKPPKKPSNIGGFLGLAHRPGKFWLAPWRYEEGLESHVGSMWVPTRTYGEMLTEIGRNKAEIGIQRERERERETVKMGWRWADNFEDAFQQGDDCICDIHVAVWCFGSVWHSVTTSISCWPAAQPPRTRALLLPMLSTAKKIVEDTHDEPEEHEVTCLFVCSVQALQTLHWESVSVSWRLTPNTFLASWDMKLEAFLLFESKNEQHSDIVV